MPAAEEATGLQVVFDSVCLQVNLLAHNNIID